jgi:hypothetical protein
MTEENSTLKENTQNITYLGFLTFIKRRCFSGYYNKSCCDFLENLGSCCGITILVILGFCLMFVLVASLLYISTLIFALIGYGIQQSEICALTYCITPTQILDFSERNGQILPKFYSNNTCCLCNTTSHTYIYFNNFREEQNICYNDGQHDVIVSGLLFFVLIALPSFIVSMLCIGMCIPIGEYVKKHFVLQWNEYINKKIDSRLSSLQQNSCDIKDSNIIYPDIESGETSRLLYNNRFSDDVIYDSSEIESVEGVRSIRSSSSEMTSEDGVMINADDTI